MAVKMRELVGRQLASLRFEPTAKRVRARLGGQTVADTREALLVWEPRRVVPAYAVPESSLTATLVPARPGGDGPSDSADAADSARMGLSLPEVSARPVLDPSVPFAVHSGAGESLDVLGESLSRPGAAFRPADDDLTGYVVLEFDAFEWLEEDEPIVSHPRDPFHRIDILRSDRHVRLELDGVLLAESSRALLLFETLLPVRFYLPVDDVAVELAPSEVVTYCAYKGRASYFSTAAPSDGPPDLAWTYREPLPDAVPVRDRGRLLRRTRGRRPGRRAPSAPRHPLVPLTRKDGLMTQPATQPTNRPLADRVVVVTGGGRGIGSATAVVLANLGGRCRPRRPAARPSCRPSRVHPRRRWPGRPPRHPT